MQAGISLSYAIGRNPIMKYIKLQAGLASLTGLCLNLCWRTLSTLLALDSLCLSLCCTCCSLGFIGLLLLLCLNLLILCVLDCRATGRGASFGSLRPTFLDDV